MRILIVNAQVPFVRGGAEILAEGLQSALERAGHRADLVRLPFKWYPAEAIPGQVLMARLADLTDFSGVRVDRVIGLKFPAYVVPHPDKRIWLVHQHRAAYDLWDSGLSDLLHAPGGRGVRDFVREADARYLRETSPLYTISRNVSARLARYSGLASVPLYHPPAHAQAYRQGAFEDYLLFPSRLDAIKRQALAIEALARTRNAVRIVFLGAPDHPATLHALQARAAQLRVASRVEWAGATTEERKIDLYARCTAVVFPPVDEDYGYVTLEAMLAGKPVITCDDSGGPLEFVRDGDSGLVVSPDAQALAGAMDRLWDDRALASRLGAAARQAYVDLRIGWDGVVQALAGDAPPDLTPVDSSPH